MSAMLSKRASHLKPSFVFELARKAERLKREGKDVLNLSLGEPVWETFSAIRGQAQKAIDEG